MWCGVASSLHADCACCHGGTLFSAAHAIGVQGQAMKAMVWNSLLAAHAVHVCVCAGMRCLSPNMNRWPAWADVFPNITLLPKIEAKTFVMHVSHAVKACSPMFARTLSY